MVMPQAPQPAMSILVLTVPGSRQLAVSPLPRTRSARSRVKNWLASLERE